MGRSINRESTRAANNNPRKNPKLPCKSLEFLGYPNYSIDTNGNIYSNYKRVKILKPTIKSDGYTVVNLYNKKRKQTFKINRLVLLAFRGFPTQNQESRHLNGIRHDNKLENLIWSTHKENIKDKFKHHTILNGSKHPSSKLKEEQVLQIRILYQSGKYSQIELSQIFHISRGTIDDIINKRSWKHI